MVEAVFFDLDGTLADTAPDLGAALNRLLEEEGRATLSVEVLRPHASAGGRGLIGAGFGLTPADAAYPALLKRFLEHYSRALCVHTTLFPGIAELLAELDRRRVRWGVVTNKPHRFSVPLLERLGIHGRAATVVSGDTTAHPKPHPEPLLFACAAARVSPRDSLYVGDDQRDVQAGRAAGMATVIAAYGYLGTGTAFSDWQADAAIQHPGELLRLMDGPMLESART